MRSLNPALVVNSVHKTTMSAPRTFPHCWDVSARAICGDGDGFASRIPQNATVEAIESNFGTPVLLVIWHPEAYGSLHRDIDEFHVNCHRTMIKFMAQAGDTYCLRRRITRNILDWQRNWAFLKEFSQLCIDVLE